jgi:N-methylhydantoinase A
LAAEGVTDMRFDFSIDIRHRGQINEVEVPIGQRFVDQASLDQLAGDFFDRYEELYGHGAAFRGAALEAVTFRCRARSETLKPALTPAEAGPVEPPEESRRGPRPVWWRSDVGSEPTMVYDGLTLRAGNAFDGPALVETPDTTVAVPPSHRLRVDEYGNFELTEKTP